MYQMMSPQLLQQMYGQQGVSQQMPMGMPQGAQQQGMPGQQMQPGMQGQTIPNLAPMQGVVMPQGGAGGAMPMGGGMQQPQQPQAQAGHPAQGAGLSGLASDATKMYGAIQNGNYNANPANATQAQLAAQQAAGADKAAGNVGGGWLASLFGSGGAGAGAAAAPAMGGVY